MINRMSTAPTTHAALAIRLPFDAPHRMAAHASKVAADFFRQFERDAETTASVHMVTQELVENLLKYSIEGDTSLEVALETTGAGRRVRITAKNRTTQDRMDDVRTRIDELEHAEDP